MKELKAHATFVLVLVCLGVGLASLCFSSGESLPYRVAGFLINFFGLVIPISISIATETHPLSFTGLLILAATQLAIEGGVWLAINWEGILYGSEVRYFPIGRYEVSIGLVTTAPLFVANYFWLTLLTWHWGRQPKKPT